MQQLRSKAPQRTMQQIDCRRSRSRRKRCSPDITPSGRFYFFLLIGILLSLCSASSENTTSIKDEVDDSTTAQPISGGGEDGVPVTGAADKGSTSSEDEMVIDDYLDSLSNTELGTICMERGFELAPRTDGMPLVRADYLEAARRCLSLEKEMNAIMAENPELAAELDKEIDRMKASKEKLEKERDEMLAMKQSLEQKLKDANGGDMPPLDGGDAATADGDAKPSPSPLGSKNAQDMSLEEVLKESFKELFERVRADIRFVTKMLDPVLKPLGTVLKVAWQVVKPLLEKIYEHGKPLAQRIAAEIKPTARRLYDKAKPIVVKLLQQGGAKLRQVVSGGGSSDDATSDEPDL